MSQITRCPIWLLYGSIQKRFVPRCIFHGSVKNKNDIQYIEIIKWEAIDYLLPVKTFRLILQRYVTSTTISVVPSQLSNMIRSATSRSRTSDMMSILCSLLMSRAGSEHLS